MPDDRELATFDPYDLFDEEAARLAAWYRSRSGDEWGLPTRCEGWDVKDLAAHLASGEEYNQACLDGQVGDFLREMGEAGVTGLDDLNAKGVNDRRDRLGPEVFEEWRAANDDTRARLRALGDGDVTTSVGPYPARWQAWHLASELATHADDAGVPVTEAEADHRLAWRAAFARFAITESHPELAVARAGDGTAVTDPGGDLRITLDDTTLVEAVNNRPDGSPQLDDATRRRLSTV
jgi:uncharacterized protein (TIGR03083 family)